MGRHRANGPPLAPEGELRRASHATGGTRRPLLRLLRPKGMLMAAKLTKTGTPGVYRRGSRYVVTFRHRGRQHRESFRTYAEAREAKARRSGGDRRPASSERVTDYAERWIRSYRGRTSRGLEDSTRKLYRRWLDQHVLPFFGGMRLRDVGPDDVREWMGWLERRNASPNTVRQARAVLWAMVATAR